MSRNDPQNKHISKTSASNGGQFSLTDDAGQLWHGTIAVGTPPISYTVDFDTGSSDLFLPGPTCNTSCEGHTIYNPNTSTTSKDLGKTFTLQYGDGSAVTGEQWNDTVIIDGLSVSVERCSGLDCLQQTHSYRPSSRHWAQQPNTPMVSQKIYSLLTGSWAWGSNPSPFTAPPLSFRLLSLRVRPHPQFFHSSSPRPALSCILVDPIVICIPGRSRTHLSQNRDIGRS